MPDLVITEDREAVRHVILNRPEKRNAFNEELVLATGAALRAAADDPTVRCVVLRGNGPVFSAGMDVAALAAAAGAPERLRAFRRDCLYAWNLAEEMTKPTCRRDPRRLSRRGARARARVRPARALRGCPRRAPETRLGLVPDVGGSSRLPQIVGVGRAKELIMTSRIIGAADAERFGLANRVAPADGLDAATDELVGELLACAPIAVGLAKRLIDASARPALSTTLELEIAAQEQCARSEDVKEGGARGGRAPRA